MPTDEAAALEKAYVKKHKLNHTLNELFLAITQNKPENPIEFAFKHFESKLPPPPPQPEPEPEPEPIVPKETSLLNLTNALSNLSTLNKINRIVIANKNKEPTEDEIIQSEIIVNSRNIANQDDEVNESENKMIYKSELKKREMVTNHKRNLKELVEAHLNLSQSKLAEKHEFVDTDANNSKSIDQSLFLSSDEQDELLLDEIALTGLSNFMSKKRHKKKTAVADKRVSLRASIHNNFTDQSILNSSRNEKISTDNQKQFSQPPPPPFVCSVCGKSKDETIAKCEQNTRPLEELQVEPSAEPSAEPSTDLNIFDMLMSTKKETTLLPTSAVKELNDAFDDENIESASQVSGPRPITPFDAGTSRSQTNNNHLETSTGGVLGWLMSTQKHSPQEQPKPSSVVSKASTIKNNRSSIANSPKTSLNDTPHQHWNVKSSSISGSELSAKNKNKK